MSPYNIWLGQKCHESQLCWNALSPLEDVDAPGFRAWTFVFLNVLGPLEYLQLQSTEETASNYQYFIYNDITIQSEMNKIT